MPQTVGAAVRQLRGHNAAFATVLDAILEAACAAAGDTGILAVTALTSLGRGDLDDLGFAADVASLDCRGRGGRSRSAAPALILVASSLEAAALRRELGQGS